MTPRAAALVLGLLFAGCAEGERPAADNAVSARADTAFVDEAYISAFIEADNIDSPAIYHGGGDTTWVIATAKATHALVVFDAVTGVEVKRVGTLGAGDGQLNRPNGILVVGDSVLFVVERDNRRVQAFRMPGFESLGTFGTAELRKPYGLTAFPSQGGWAVYVTDSYELVEDSVPPLDSLGERMRQYQVTLANGRVSATLTRTFGDTTEAGAIRIAESIYADPANDRLLIAEELETDSYIKIYTLDGRFTGQTMGRGEFPQQAEGIALYACGTDAGYWITTDQGPVVNTFHVFDRMTFKKLASFAAAKTNTTDGIALTQKGFGPFPAGAFVMAHGDAAISALSWATIAERTGLRGDCTEQ
jgi:3-phytase